MQHRQDKGCRVDKMERTVRQGGDCKVDKIEGAMWIKDVGAV